MMLGDYLDLKELKILRKYMQTTKHKDISARCLEVLWVEFSQTVPGTECLQVREDSSELPLFSEWIETGEEHPY